MPAANLKHLLRDLHAREPETQIDALIELINMEAREAVPSIIPLLASPNVSVRADSVRALGYLAPIGDNSVGSALLSMLQDNEALVRSEAAEALGSLRHRPAIDLLKTLLKNDPEWLVRASAAEALGNIGDPSAIPALEHALDDEMVEVQLYAAISLGLLATPDFIPRLQRYIAAKANAPRVQEELIITGYRLGAPGSLKRVLALIKNSNDRDDAGALLNAIEDITNRKIPLTLREDAPQLRDELDALAQRIPILWGHVQNIKANLDRLEQGASATSEKI
jgi:HEAT repeat protein